MEGHPWEELQQIGIAQAHTTVGARHAHRLAVRCAMQIYVTLLTIDLTALVDTGLAAGQPENPREYPVTLRVLLVQLL